MSQRDEQLPRYEREYFANQQLALALVQVQYPPAARFASSNVLTALKEAMEEDYPMSSPSVALNVLIGPQGVSQSPVSNGIRFSSLDQRWVVQLNDTSVSLETRRYEEIDDFATRFTDVLKIVVDHLRPRYELRYGLRYVDEFRYDKARTYDGWRALLNPQLLGLGATGILGGKIEQTLGEVSAKRSDGTLLVRHGFLTGTTVTPTDAQPAKTGPFYLLDVDYYREGPKELQVGSISNLMKQYNDVMYRVFRWAIGDGELYRYLRG